MDEELTNDTHSLSHIDVEEGDIYIKLRLLKDDNLEVVILDYTDEGSNDEKMLVPLAHGFAKLVNIDAALLYKAGVEDLHELVEMEHSSVIH